MTATKRALDAYLTEEEIGWIMEIKRDRATLKAKVKTLTGHERRMTMSMLEGISNANLAQKFEVPEWVIQKV